MPSALRSMLALTALSAAILALGGGCSPGIGDGCSTSTNCSASGDRICDTTQPGGACTVFDCQPDTCPGDAVCVLFNPTEPRRAVLACMKPCSSDGDCRQDRGYRCVEASTYDDGLYAEVTDLEDPSPRFCAAVEAD